jgi:DNA helicase-2/ATP-dependent DNA helicase PcrA
LLGSQNSPVVIGEKVTVTNYHGFCKGILKKYGYLLSDALRKDINLFRAVGDSDIEKYSSLKTVITSAELQSLKAIEVAVKEAHVPDAQQIHAYNDIIIRKLLPLEYITHNAIILFVLEIFDKHSEVKKFYQNYYPLIVVDEFQDTNCIAWELLKSIIVIIHNCSFLEIHYRGFMDS